MPFPIGISVGSLGSGLIMNRTGRYYYLGIGSMFLFNVGTGLFCSLNIGTLIWSQYLYLFFFGTGYGAVLTVGLLALIAAVKHSQQATTTSSCYLFRATGGTIGAAVGSAVFQTALRKFLTENLGDGEAAQEIIGRVLSDFREILKIPEPWRHLVVGGCMDALRMTFVAGSGMGVMGLVMSTLMKEHELHKTLDRR